MSSIFNPAYKLESFNLNEIPRRRFTWGVIKYFIIFGFVGSYLVTDNRYRLDDIGIRPDKQIGRIMTDVPLRERKVNDFFTGKYFDKPFVEERSQSLFKRTLEYLYPYQYYKPAEHDYLPFYDYTKDYVTPSMENHYHFKQ
jgi:hypothetical protein